jgi:hypothetical protein
MLNNIHFETALTTCKPTSPVVRSATIETIRERAKVSNGPKTEIKVGAPSEITSKLNELAKRRPFNILYRVKKYDPL